MKNRRFRCYNYKVNKSGSYRNIGNLSVRVQNGSSNEPIAFAEVNIYNLTTRGLYGENGDANLIVRHVTDENGEVPLIELPVLDRTDSSRSQYYATVRHFRYHPVILLNLKIYPNITTEYNVLLTPLTLRHPDFEFIITPELL